MLTASMSGQHFLLGAFRENWTLEGSRNLRCANAGRYNKCGECFDGLYVRGQ